MKGFVIGVIVEILFGVIVGIIARILIGILIGILVGIIRESSSESSVDALVDLFSLSLSDLHLELSAKIRLPDVHGVCIPEACGLPYSLAADGVGRPFKSCSI